MKRFPIALFITLTLCLRTSPQILAATDKDAATEAQLATTADVTLIAEGKMSPLAPRTFVITHGMGGTTSGDRFELLARQLKENFPEANVFRIDWSKPATATTFFGLPNPWIVAGRIDGVAAQAAQQLRAIDVDPQQVTLIGESFGVYVNQRIARALGGVQGMLAFNPASEEGGY
ncbi:MAG: hypothetical protein WAN65_08990, partial [Candidatus Sulfotelmatobacter sp.]